MNLFSLVKITSNILWLVAFYEASELIISFNDLVFRKVKNVKETNQPSNCAKSLLCVVFYPKGFSLSLLSFFTLTFLINFPNSASIFFSKSGLY